MRFRIFWAAWRFVVFSQRCIGASITESLVRRWFGLKTTLKQSRVIFACQLRPLPMLAWQHPNWESPRRPAYRRRESLRTGLFLLLVDLVIRSRRQCEQNAAYAVLDDHYCAGRQECTFPHVPAPSMADRRFSNPSAPADLARFVPQTPLPPGPTNPRLPVCRRRSSAPLAGRPDA